jgi:hypothetical protein
VHGNRARAKVRQWFKAQQHEATVAQGRALVERELARLGQTALKLDAVAAKAGFDKTDEFFAAFARDDINSKHVQTAILAVAQPAAAPLPSFLESYTLAETPTAPLEIAALDLPTPEPIADVPAALDPTTPDAPTVEPAEPAPGESPDDTLAEAEVQTVIDTLAEAEVQTVIDAPPPARAAGRVPPGLEALAIGRDAATPDGLQATRPETAPLFEGIDLAPAPDDAPAPGVAPLEPVRPTQPEPSASTPRRSLVPLIAMLIAGIALGYPAGYLTAPRSQPAPAAPVAKPAAQPSAATPPPAAPVPAAPATTAAPAKTPGPAAPPAPTAAARKPPETKAAAPTTRKPPPTKPTAFVGTLTISSRPAGATVILDGRVAGTTPLTMSGVAAGSHAVRLELEGYRTWSMSAQVAAGQSKRVNASLEQRERRPER